MCNAASVGIGSLGLQAGGGIFSAYQARNAGEANGLYYDTLEKRNRDLASISRDQGQLEATYAQNEGAQKTKVLQNQEKKVSASQQAQLAANGVDVSSGTSEDIAKDTFDAFKMDELAIRLQADQKAFQGKNYAELRALDYESQADSNRLSAANARSEGQTRLYTGLINTAASVGESYFKLNKEGVFDQLKQPGSIDLTDTVPNATERFDYKARRDNSLLGGTQEPDYRKKAYQDMFGDIGVSASANSIAKEFSGPASYNDVMKSVKDIKLPTRSSIGGLLNSTPMKKK